MILKDVNCLIGDYTNNYKYSNCINKVIRQAIAASDKVSAFLINILRMCCEVQIPFDPILPDKYRNVLDFEK
jgi:hypothetical protein